MPGFGSQLITAILAALMAVIVPAAQAPPKIDTSTIGPQVGDRIPAFSGTDQFGTFRNFATSAGPHGLMLVFFRSADW